MHRLVIALTTLLALIGATVVAGYLLVFAGPRDRAAAAVPANVPVYLNVYLQPSTAQQMKLGELLGRLPGFGDRATLDTKVDEALQQALAGTGLDYRGDLKPWLGDQLSIAYWPDVNVSARALLIATVRDRPAAEASLARIAARDGPTTSTTYGGASLVSGDRGAYAFLADDLVAVATTADLVRSAIDTRGGSQPALASAPAFRQASDTLPDDYLASAYLDLTALAQDAGVTQGLAGWSTVSVALTAGDDGLELHGQAPFDTEVADASARAAVALTNEPASLTDWMPAGTEAEVVVFGLRGALATLEQQAAATPATDQLAQALTQLRAIVAFGLGLNVDEDLLPLLDREAAVAVSGLGGGAHGQLLLRPSDPAAAEQALGRIRDALSQRGATVTTSDAGGVTITSIAVPQLGGGAYAMSDGVVVMGLTGADVEAALTSHAGASTLAGTRAYRDTFSALGVHGGHELYVDGAGLVKALGAALNLSGETRDMLQHVGAIGLTVPARQDHIEFHAIVTIR